jgi:multidrug efflux pump subunit AcrA (membrane-fusion protein)
MVRDTRRSAETLPLLAASALVLLVGCRSQVKAPPAEVRPVRAVTIEKRDAGVPVVLMGRIKAQDEAALSFQLSGRMTERAVNLGDSVKAGQLIARLDPHNERNALLVAEANR